MSSHGLYTLREKNDLKLKDVKIATLAVVDVLNGADTKDESKGA